jgi:hypothetical protein
MANLSRKGVADFAHDRETGQPLEDIFYEEALQRYNATMNARARGYAARRKIRRSAEFRRVQRALLDYWKHPTKLPADLVPVAEEAARPMRQAFHVHETLRNLRADIDSGGDGGNEVLVPTYARLAYAALLEVASVNAELSGMGDDFDALEASEIEAFHDELLHDGACSSVEAQVLRNALRGIVHRLAADDASAWDALRLLDRGEPRDRTTDEYVVVHNMHKILKKSEPVFARYQRACLACQRASLHRAETRLITEMRTGLRLDCTPEHVAAWSARVISLRTSAARNSVHEELLAAKRAWERTPRSPQVTMMRKMSLRDRE